MPEVAKWHAPDKSAEAAVASFKTQYSTFANGAHKVPDAEKLGKVIDRMVDEYPKVPLDVSQFADILTAEMTNVKPSASPGYPLMRLCPTNAVLFETMGVSHIHALVMRRLELLSQHSVAEIQSMSAEELCLAGLVDPIRVFVKNEVHSTKKVHAGTYRLIMSVSIIDQLVERVIDGSQDRAEIDLWEDLCSKPGMGLHDEGLAILSATFRALKVAMGSDMSGFDWHTSQWMLDADALCRDRASGGDTGEVHMKRAQLVGNAVFIFPDGRVYAQRIKGLQKSGTKTTSSGNSRIRAITAKLVGGPETAVCTMGDDAVEDVGDRNIDLVRLKSDYAEYGMDIKGMEFIEPNGLEFCAYRFYPEGTVEPVRWDKMMAAFCYTWPQPSAFEDRLFALDYELRHSPKRDFVIGYLRELAHKLVGGDQ